VSTGAAANASTWNSGYAQIKSDLNSGSYDPYFRHMVISMTTGEDITAGNAVRISGATILKCDSGSAAGITGFIGFALETKTNGSACKVSTNSVYGLTSLTAGAIYYLGASGAITSTKPTVFARPIGIAVSSSALFTLNNTEADATFYSINCSGKISVNNGGSEVFSLHVGTTTQMEMSLLGDTGFIYATVSDNNYGKFLVRDNYSNTHPAYSFLNDPSTGIGNDIGLGSTLNFMTGGIEAMRITSAQKVGIGTTTPGTRLSVAGAISIDEDSSFGNRNILSFNINANSPEYRYFTGICRNSADGSFRIASGDVQNTLIQCGSDVSYGKTVFQSVSWSGTAKTYTNRMTINGYNGNIGIGTDTPEEKLDVAGAICLTDGISTPSTHGGKATIYVDSADGDLKVRFGDGTVKTIVSDT
jgi:hypothetical protein